SAARRLFFEGDAVASEETGERAAACRNSPLVQRRKDLTQCEVRLLTDEGEDPLRMLLQWRSTSATRRWLARPVVAKALHPPDRGTDADIKLFGRVRSRPSCFHEANDSHSQLTRIVHALVNPPANQCVILNSLLHRTLGIPIHSGRD